MRTAKVLGLRLLKTVDKGPSSHQCRNPQRRYEDAQPRKVERERLAKVVADLLQRLESPDLGGLGPRVAQISTRVGSVLERLFAVFLDRLPTVFRFHYASHELRNDSKRAAFLV